MSKDPNLREVHNYTIKGFKQELYYAMHLAVVDLFGDDVYSKMEGMSGDRSPEFITIVDPDTGKNIRMPIGMISISEAGQLAKARRHRRGYDSDDDDDAGNNNINIKCRYEAEDMTMSFEVNTPKHRAEEAELLVDGIRTNAIQKSFLQNKVIRPDTSEDNQEVHIIPINRIKGQDVFVYSSIERGLVPLVSRLTGTSEGLGINNKYSLLLHGKGGTGKTSMMFNYVAPIAVENGYTVIFCDNAKEYSKILDIAEVLVEERGWKVITIVEDIDQAFDGEVRGDMQQTILNKIDAGYNKDMKLINVLTTNYIERISSYMLRAGRISKILHVGGLIRTDIPQFCERYMGTMFDPTDNYTNCIELLEDMPASFVREIIDESKTLAAFDGVAKISGYLFETTIKSYKHQEELTFKQGVDAKDKVIDALRVVADVIGINPQNLATIMHMDNGEPVSMGGEFK